MLSLSEFRMREDRSEAAPRSSTLQISSPPWLSCGTGDGHTLGALEQLPTSCLDSVPPRCISERRLFGQGRAMTRI